MSSCIAVQCSEGFIVSTDTIGFKNLLPFEGVPTAKIKTSTHKLFAIGDDVLVAANGDFTNYLPVLNENASLEIDTSRLVDQILIQASNRCKADRLFVLSRVDKKVRMDVCLNGVIGRTQFFGCSFPMRLLENMWIRLWESPEGNAIRASGMLGPAALISGFNALAATLNSDMQGPFDTVLFLDEGMFVLSGGVESLPVSNFF